VGGPDSRFEVALPAPGEAPRGILETYTKAHSAEYQTQAFIDLAFNLRREIGDLTAVERIEIHTSAHTHVVVGSGANDPQKFDPGASRETLDHSLMYIFAVALEDGRWGRGGGKTRAAGAVDRWGHKIRAAAVLPDLFFIELSVTRRGRRTPFAWSS